MGNSPMTARLAEVLNHQLNESNLSVSAASRKTGIPYPTLYRRLNSGGRGLTSGRPGGPGAYGRRSR